MAKPAKRVAFRAAAHGMTWLALGSVCLVAGCGESGSSNPRSSGSPASNEAPSTLASSTAEATPFVSAHYHYTVNSADWIGSQAQTVWNGKGAPGDGDPTVDALYGPRLHQVWVVSAPTADTLNAFAPAFRQRNARVHPCPETPEASQARQIDGEPAIVDSMHCPPPGGVFALNALVKHGDRIYVIFTYDQPGQEAAMQKWFGELLDSLSFDA